MDLITLFHGDAVAKGLCISNNGDLSEALRLLNLTGFQLIVIVHGGAVLDSDEDADQIRQFFLKVLPILCKQFVVMIADGGTDTGVYAILGNARKQASLDFPLLGVVPQGKVKFERNEPKTSGYPLEPNHTHFLIVEGNNFGDESDVLLSLSRTAAPSSVVWVINGGSLTRREAIAHSTSELNNPVFIIAGSGRVANELAYSFDQHNLEDSGIMNRTSATNMFVFPVSGSPDDFLMLMSSVLRDDSEA